MKEVARGQLSVASCQWPGTLSGGRIGSWSFPSAEADKDGHLGNVN